MKCHACGHENADSALFCTNCRRPLVAPAKLPSRLEPAIQNVVPPPPPRAPAAAPVPVAAPAATGGVDMRNPYAPPETNATGRGVGDASVMTDEEAWTAVIGDTNTHYYLDRFERLSHGQGGGWHWPAFFVTLFWMLYRKMWLGALLYFFARPAVFILAGVFTAISPALGGLAVLAGFLSLLLVPAGFANTWYYNLCRGKIRDVRRFGGSKEQMLARLESKGGTSGVLLVILVIFVSISMIGILAAVALPAYQTYTVKAKMVEVVRDGQLIADDVGRTYEQTGALPTDVDRLVAEHPSKYVRTVKVDSTSGTVTVLAEIPGVDGGVVFTPSADNNRHLTWTCGPSGERMARYMPPSCR